MTISEISEICLHARRQGIATPAEVATLYSIKHAMIEEKARIDAFVDRIEKLSEEIMYL